ncbi:MAG TPA: asparaginase [Candidatus Eisenbacteria bacterium]|nr:asparaginase [Candidatus Eisenbacteria bacterium]
MNQKKNLPLVKVVATGGTIANTPSGRLHAGEVAQVIPELKNLARVEIEEIFRVGSSDITPDRWLIIAKRINELAAQEDIKGFVVTHGSNTLEETAYFLHLVVKTNRPVVLTAAQRQFSMLSSDSPKNLLDAVRVAACEEAAGKGVMTVVNDEINCAREVTKRMSYRLQTYTSPDVGVLGFVDLDRVTFYRLPTRKHTVFSEFGVQNLERLPRVDILYTASGTDGVLIDAAVQQAKSEGLVIAVSPTGAPAPGMKEALRRAARSGIPVVYANRGGHDRLRVMLPEEPFVAGDNLNPQKARVLLMLALTKTKDLENIQRIFDKH